MDFQELTSIYDEHWRLIYEAGQTPPVALLVRMHALAALRDRFPDRQVWIGFGYGIAQQILETATDSVLALDPSQFRELTELLSYAATQGDRQGHDSGSEMRFRAAINDLERKYRAGSRPPGGSAEWIAVPIVYELFGQPTIPDFRDLRAVGVQWLRIELAHVTPISSVLMQGMLDESSAAYLSQIVEQLDELVPARRFAGAPSLKHLAVRVELFPETRLRGFSAGMAFLLQLLLARDSARPVRHSLGWKTPVAATGVLNGHRFAEVTPLDEKLTACARAGIRTVFVPGVQAEIAREITSANRLDLRIEGLDTAEDAGVIADRTSDWIVARKRSIREQSAQAWFWYFRSPLRTVIVSLAAFLLLFSALCVLWPVPTSVDWPEGQRLVLKNWIGHPVAHPSTGFRPPDGALSTWNDEYHWAMLPKGRRLLPLTLIIWGSSSGRTDVMALLDWRGRVIETFESSEDPTIAARGTEDDISDARHPGDPGNTSQNVHPVADTDTSQGTDVVRNDSRSRQLKQPEDVHWAPFQLRTTTSGHPVVLATLRSIAGSSTVLRVFENVGSRLVRRGFAWQKGHLEHFACLDLNDDGQPDQIAMGWAQHLTSDGTEKPGLPRGERGRSIAHVIDLDALRNAEWADLPMDEVPSLLDSTATGYGLLASWSFPLDRATEELSSRCIAVRRAGPGLARFSCFGNSKENVVEYEIRVDADFGSRRVYVGPNDPYSDFLESRGWRRNSIKDWADVLGAQITTRTARSPAWHAISTTD